MQIIEWSITITIYIVSIVCNIQKEFSPEQRNIFTIHISVSNSFSNSSLYYDCHFVYFKLFISSLRCYYCSVYSTISRNKFCFVFYFIKKLNVIFKFDFSTILITIFFYCSSFVLFMILFISFLIGLIEIFSLVTIIVYIIFFNCKKVKCLYV